MIKPYPVNIGELSEQIFNYRLSRAKRVIEILLECSQPGLEYIDDYNCKCRHGKKCCQGNNSFV